MLLETVEITTITEARAEGRRRFLEYRQILRESAGKGDDATRDADALLMRSYREIARGRAVLDLAAVMRAAGLVPGQWYPKLAICRADAPYCHVRMRINGGATFSPARASKRWGGREVETAKARTIVLAPGTFPTYEHRLNPQIGYVRIPDPGAPARAWSETAEALVPTIPPAFRPPFKLSGYCLLWEAVWSPAPPVDPLLLKPLGGNLYAVLAQWDLSPLERAVLTGRL